MKREQWQEIVWAAARLELAGRATLAEIKRAYRKGCKVHHPDIQAAAGNSPDDPGRAMTDLNRAYRILLDYCAGYHFPLQPGAAEEQDDEEWWMNRFGNDPLWGKGPGGA
ncbi:MAG: J domain-containing protein [Thermodesulfobacteriota bacterium]